LLDGGDALRRGRYFDEDVRARDGRMQTTRLGHRVFGGSGEVRRHFEADVPVAAVCAGMHRLQQIRGRTNVINGQMFVHRLRIRRRLREERLDRRVVRRAAGDRLLEDRRVRGHADNAVALNQAGEFARLEHGAMNVVEPEALAQLPGLVHGMGHLSLLEPPMLARQSRETPIAIPRSRVRPGGYEN